MIRSNSWDELMDRIAAKPIFGTLLALAAITVVAVQIDGQSPPNAVSAPPAFDIASFRALARPYPSGGGPWTVDHGRFIAQTGWVRAVIGFAYNVLPPVKVHGGPTWIDTDLYDFEAKAEDSNAGPDQIRAMMQTLLFDRFKLVVHRETREEQVYTLVVGKNGSKMQEAKEGRRDHIDFPGPGQIVCTECELGGALTGQLSNILENPVLDNTGLKGFYNFRLEFADPRWRSKDGNPLPSELASRPDIFTAVQEQLGLKLEARKGPVEILVVDHIERPSEN
jgi:uncharacterized protein (TIGR03435 family)